ncbi:MAG: phosphoglycerate mutase, partial [Ramlibacter sp.]
VSGAGALPVGGNFAPPPDLQITHYLRDAALLEDWRGWVAAWHQVDSKECARLVDMADSGDAVTLTLCGERNARTFTSTRRAGPLRRLRGWIAGKQAAAVLETL